MARNISFALTTPQFIAGTKTVTRRMGWRTAVAGQELCGVKKGMGLRPGEKIERLGMIRLVNVRTEPLRRLTDDLEYGFAETTREGFPEGRTPPSIRTRVERNGFEKRTTCYRQKLQQPAAKTHQSRNFG